MLHAPGGTSEHWTSGSQKYFRVTSGLKAERAAGEGACGWDDAGTQRKMPEHEKEDVRFEEFWRREGEDEGPEDFRNC
ncbi:hypothetical protein NDU88_001694 [Pleurodeles waltl]|uniref:Uncharacterized protein n=1 Tax=Pleurodeles waltl TaxID=8319 RepID=A0AAV7Q7L6_PLEWA|nr:hypothetical protein NDU88_001694 [Pleurodeles waltl]